VFLILGYEKFAQVVVIFIIDPEMMGFTECDVEAHDSSNY
jgi:hypothetical protein